MIKKYLSRVLADLSHTQDSLHSYIDTKIGSGQSVFHRLIIPLSVIMISLSFATLVIFLYHHHQDTNEAHRFEIDNVTHDFALLLKQQTVALEMGTLLVASDPTVQQALRDGDANTLLTKWKPLFEKMNWENRLTHFYFLDKQRICLLRVHNPTRRGDLINRFTALESEWTQKVSSGIELGDTGALTLRVVRPVYAGETLVGYVEMGKEIEDIIGTLHARSDYEAGLVIHKNRLSRTEWEGGMRMLGRSPNWDQSPNNVLSYISNKNLAESLRVLGNSQDYSDAEKEFVADNKHWYAFSLPMKAVSGETVGELFIMRDMSTSQALFLRFMIVSSGIYAMVVGVMLALIYLLLRRTDMYIHLQQQNIRDNELRFMQLADQSRTMVWEIDAEGMYTYVSDVAALILGYQPDEMIGRLHFYDLHPEEGREAFKIAALEVFARKEPFVDFENQVMTRDGQMIWVATNGIPIENADGTLAGYRGSDVEITERKKNDEKIRLLAFYDSLSALPNKTLLIERMKLAMSESVRSGEYGALILIDLDNFKIINDTLGYKTGDMMLKQAAQRITSCVRESDTVARLGGDEFVVVLVGLSQNQLDAATASETIAEKILSRLNQKYMLNDVAYSSTASMGMTLFHGHENTLEDLIKQSDLALYRSKAQGKNTLSFFDPEMESALKQRLDLEDALSKGIEEGEFVLYYQPQVYQNGEVVGAEALIRWVHPEKGMISPADFIPIAEDTGLILPLGRWILQAACDQLSQWGRYEKTADITLAVNVSVHQFSQSNFVEEVLAALQHSGADPKKLKLEITESLLISNIEEITEKMNRLKSSGVSFSLDDFGTGYSSLVYLKRLPLDQLKIDQSFVKDLLVNANDAIICKSVIAIAKSMSFSVIAEGVETQQQRDALAKMGCYDYQGYWFSRPLPLEEFEAFVASSRIDSRL